MPRQSNIKRLLNCVRSSPSNTRHCPGKRSLWCHSLRCNMDDTSSPRPLRSILSGLYPMSEVEDYCVKCNHLTTHTKVRLPDRTAWVCDICEEVHTSKDPMDSCDE